MGIHRVKHISFLAESIIYEDWHTGVASVDVEFLKHYESTPAYTGLVLHTLAAKSMYSLYPWKDRLTYCRTSDVVAQWESVHKLLAEDSVEETHVRP